MPYLNIDLNFFQHPKTIRLEGELGGHRAPLIPIKLWAHVGKFHSEDGFLRGYSPAAVAKAIGYDSSKAVQLVDALIHAGFITRKKDGFQVHDWHEHNGHLTLFRERARNAAKARWNKSKAAPDSPKPDSGNKSPAKSALPLTDEQVAEIRRRIAESCKHRMISEANEIAWQELSAKLKKAARNKKIKNLYAYAITAAGNMGKDKPI